MLRTAVGAVALLAVAGGVAFGVYKVTDDSAEADVEVVRWGNVTVSVPEGSSVTVAREFEGPEINPPDGGPVLVLAKGESRLLIDAENGEVLLDLLQEADRAVIEQVLTTLTVSTQDKGTAPWPYTEVPPNIPRERRGNITFIPPDPSSGVIVRTVVNDPGGYSLRVTNGRSTLSIDADTGAVIDEITLIHPEDKEALDRFFSTVEYLGPSP